MVYIIFVSILNARLRDQDHPLLVKNKHPEKPQKKLLMSRMTANQMVFWKMA